MSRALVCLFPVFLATVSAQPYVISTIAGGVPPATPGPAQESSIGDPPRVAVDSDGNVYFPSVHSVFKVDRAGTLSRIAGTGRSGNTGDGGPAINAQLANPIGIALDGSGNIYVADKDANVVRKIAESGLISTVATDLNGPMGLTVDRAGALYIADTGNNLIKRLGADGVLTTVAGIGVKGYSGDAGPALNAMLDSPEGVAVDGSFGIYIADTFNNRVRRVATDGSITTIAGNGRPLISGIKFSGDGEDPVDASLFFPTDVALDANDELYIADLGNSRIRWIHNHVIMTIAGASTGSPPFEGAKATSVTLTGPTGLAVQSDGTLFFAEGSIGSGSGHDHGDYKIWKVSQSGTITTLAGLGLANFSGDGGPARVAQLNGPTGLAFDIYGNLFISDTLNQRVRRITPAGRIDTITGDGSPAWFGDLDTALNAGVHTPLGLAGDSSGNIYLADSDNSRIRRFRDTGNIETVAGNGNASYFGDTNPARNASINHPQGLAVDASGNLYIADTLNHAVRRVTQDGAISTVAGTGRPGFGGDGGQAVNALLKAPRAVAVDGDGNLYIADSGNNAVRKVDSSGVLSTVATGLNDPRGLAVDRNGNVYIADTGHNQIAKLSPGGSLAIIAGSGQCCYAGDDGAAVDARLNTPWGITLDAAGNVYFADSGNNAIRVLQPVSSIPVVTAVTNAASNQPSPVASGEMVVLYGSGVGPLDLTTGDSAGVTVRFNDLPGTVLYASATQVGAVVPAGIAVGSGISAVVQYRGASSAPFALSVGAAAPAIFTQDSLGSGQAVAFNDDGSVNSAAHPAAPGSVIVLNATGIPLGFGANVTVGGQRADVQFDASQSPSPGLQQLRVTVPANTPPGNAVALTVEAGGVSSQDGVTIAVGAR